MYFLYKIYHEKSNKYYIGITKQPIKKRLSQHKECKRNTGINNSFFGKLHSEETKQKMRQAKLGKKLSLEHKTKVIQKSEKYKKYYKLTSPNGEIVEGFGIKDFCRKNNLNYYGIYRLISNKRKTYKDWKKHEYK